MLNVKDVMITEYNVQHIAHNELAKHYKTILGEVKVKLPGQRGARFDLIVFDEQGDALFSVEIKRRVVGSHAKKRHYEEVLGIPNYLISGVEQANNAYDVIQEQRRRYSHLAEEK